MKKRRNFPIEYQKSHVDCGPTALKMIARFYGKEISVEKLHTVCGMTEKGVSIKGLRIGAQCIGLQSLAIKCTFDELVKYVPLPAIAFWEDKHFVVVYEICEHYINVADPMTGYMCYTYKEFCQHWIHSFVKRGVLLTFEPL